MKRMGKFVSALFIFTFAVSSLYASEVIEDTHTQVVVREHPKTGKPYVSIVSRDKPLTDDPFAKAQSKFSRPDYHMLDPKIKSGQIPYDGPYSSSKKIYIFAATLATLGAGGMIGAAALPAASTGAAASGGGAYLAAGSAVAAGTAGTVAIQTRSNPNQDNFIQISKSKAVEEKNKEKSSEVILSKESESDRPGAQH